MGELKTTLAIPQHVVRNDRDAMRVTGHKSPWRFSLWAVKHGLKPAAKKSRHEHTIYRVAQLKAVCDAEVAAQFKD